MKFGVIGYVLLENQVISNLKRLGINNIILLRECGHGNEDDYEECNSFGTFK